MAHPQGDRVYIVRVTRDLAPNGEMRVTADSVTTGTDGSLCFINHGDGQRFQGTIIPPGNWMFARVEGLVEIPAELPAEE